MVLFVVADPVERHGGGGKTCRNAVATIINQFVNQHPGWVGNRVAERIGITDWQELFPARHRLAQHFFDLRCLVPAGPPDRLWVERRWLARDPQTGGLPGPVRTAPGPVRLHRRRRQRAVPCRDPAVGPQPDSGASRCGS